MSADFDYSHLVSTGARGLYHNLSHMMLENPFRHQHFSRILEVGGGNFEHLNFVKSTFDEYLVTDLIQPKVSVPRTKNKIKFQLADIHALPYENDCFDRIIVTCVLHHVNDPRKAISELFRVLKPGGHLSILLPCDPGILFRLIRRVTSDKYLKNSGVDVELLRAIEHRNHFLSIETLLYRKFADCSIRKRSFPAPLLPWHLRLFSVFHVEKISQGAN